MKGLPALAYNFPMHILTWSRRLRARIAWIACLAILLNALVPLATHAMQAWPAAGRTVEVCTALGMTTIQLGVPADTGADSPGGKPGKAGTHCGYCIAHAAADGLPPAAVAQAAPAAGRALRPALYYQAPRPLFAWSPAQPRAPPPA